MNSWQTPRLFLRERNETGLSRLDSLATNQRKGETGINGEAVAAISEAIGVVAILISLAYLAVQIRQSTHEFSRGIEANQLAAFERNIESGNRLREVLLLNPDLIDLMTKGYASYTTLDAAAKIRFGLLLRNIFSSMQGAYVRHLSLENDTRGFEGSGDGSHANFHIHTLYSPAI